MNSELLIKHGRVIDPANNIDRECDVLIVDGKVADIGKIEKSAQTVIDAAGKLVTPGLIDIHVHLREPGDEEEETIASGSAAAPDRATAAPLHGATRASSRAVAAGSPPGSRAAKCRSSGEYPSGGSTTAGP